jgi:hypothetical protein
MIIAQLNAKLMPFDRGQYFEDPLDAALRERGLGEVTGGGTAQSKSGEILYCDIEIQAPRTAVEFIADTLEALGAPIGSFLTEGDSDVRRRIGKAEGIAVYLNGTDLPAEVYSSCDVNFVCSEFSRLLGSRGRFLSYWQGPTETGLYIYGASFTEMRNLLAHFLAEYPLCHNCRIAQIA